MQKDTANIMQEYEQQYTLFSDFTEKVEKLIRELLKETDIEVHSISSRLKNSTSLEKKLNRVEGNYSKLSDVADISGIRIITYFANDVDKVAKVIEDEFDIDEENSVDKRVLLDPDRFGYISLHHIAKLINSRLQLTEYRRFSNCKVEIQVRSILQHTWAEIEHDLGYKSKESIPKDIRRRFSRLAGLLEIADDEFIQIRDSLKEYERTISKIIIDAPSSVLIDQASLSAFVKNSTLVHELDQRIATEANARISKTEIGNSIINELKYNGLETIADIESALREFGDIAVQLAGKWLKDTQLEEIKVGISLFYLCYILAARNGSAKEVLGYLKAFNIVGGKPQESAAEDIISHCTNASSNVKS